MLERNDAKTPPLLLWRATVGERAFLASAITNKMPVGMPEGRREP